MGKVTQRLAGCTDAAAIAAELRAALPTLAATEDRQAAVDDVAVFLTAEEEHWRVAMLTLISELSGDDQDCNVHMELLDVLLTWAAQETVQKNHDILETLLMLFNLVITRLGDGGDGRSWLKWGDQVLAVVHQSAVLLEKQELLERAKGEEEVKKCVVKIAALLLHLRNRIESDDSATPDLKTVTFVWKNMAKLATGFGPTLVDAAVAGANIDEKDAGGQCAEPFNVDEVLAAVVSSVEQSVGKLLRVLDEQVDAAPELGALKFLKLYWRAFQRLVAAFGNSLECELENCVLAVVNVASSLIYAVRHSQVPATSKPGQELRAMLNQAVEITEKLTANSGSALDDQAKENARTLLWYPSNDMVRAVGQRQPADITNVDMENSIQWGHLLVLTAFAGSSAANASALADTDTPFSDTNRAVEFSQLFARYRECALSDSISRSVEATDLFTDLILEYLLSFDSVVELQLNLLKQTLYPDWAQRTLCWEIWRELLCSCWNEALAVQTLQMLIDVTQWEDADSGKSFVLASGVGDEILQLLAFIYADMPLALKDVCMDQVTAVIDMISSEGPGHQFNLLIASQLHLLETLAGVHFLQKYDGPMKDEWVGKYLPMCFECCGTILELMTAETKAPTSKRETIFGMVRVLDMCLLVLRGVFDDNEPRQDDIAELSIILVRMSTEALSQLAKQSKQHGGSQSVKTGLQLSRKRSSSSVKLEKTESRSIERAIETSLYLLSKLGPVLKSNTNNQCAQVMKDLLAIIDNMQNVSKPSDTLVITARFLNEALFDMQVAGRDMPVVWQLLLALFQKLFASTRSVTRPVTQLPLLLSICLDALYDLLAHSNIVELPGAPLNVLLAGDLKQSFKESVSMRKLTPEEVGKALDIAQANTLESLLRNQSACYRVFIDRFPEEPSGLYAEANEDCQVTSAVSNKRSSEDSEATPQKRHKLSHFVALCREIEASLSSLDNDEAAANLLTGNELEEATAVLHKLLAKAAML
ncbi:hypothetical protein KRP22_001383 [Phytophthora ramorum]|nr:hypothetical protein KRP22_7208 [Phytophthora ramorum]